MSHIAIIGAGVAGLSVAFELLQAGEGHTVRVYEAATSPGGNIRTDHVDGFTIEWGPNGFLDNVPETLDLVRRLGISGRLFPASAASKRRFIWRRGRLHEIRPNPVAFFASDLLSLPGRLRIMTEPFAESRPDGDESVYQFACRHIGPEAASVLVDAMVSGVFAGDSHQLSLRYAFPRMYQMERAHGSLVRAMLARLRERRTEIEKAGRRSALRETAGAAAGPLGHLTSFKGGMADLVAGLVRGVGTDRIRLGSRVGALERDWWGRFGLRTANGSVERADAVVVAVPAWDAAAVVAELAPDMAEALSQIPGAALSVVATAFRREQMEHPLDGFGFLVPRGEGLTILGSLWTSSIFPGRAPAGFVLLRTMIGGAHSPEMALLPDDELCRIVLADLRASLGIAAQPALRRIYRHPRGIPQYVLGHEGRLRRVYAACERIPGLYVAGNSYGGIAVNACAKAARPLAARILADLRA